MGEGEGKLSACLLTGKSLELFLAELWKGEFLHSSKDELRKSVENVYDVDELHRSELRLIVVRKQLNCLNSRLEGSHLQTINVKGGQR